MHLRVKELEHLGKTGFNGLDASEKVKSRTKN